MSLKNLIYRKVDGILTAQKNSVLWTLHSRWEFTASDLLAQSIPRIQFRLNILVQLTLLCCYCLQITELCHIYPGNDNQMLHEYTWSIIYRPR